MKAGDGRKAAAPADLLMELMTTRFVAIPPTCAPPELRVRSHQPMQNARP